MHPKKCFKIIVAVTAGQYSSEVGLVTSLRFESYLGYVQIFVGVVDLFYRWTLWPGIRPSDGFYLEITTKTVITS